MSRLIDADALIAEMHNVILEDGEDRRTFYEVIERQPTKDAVEVVRCRDCKHWKLYESSFGKRMFCYKDDVIRNADDYCSYGEREGE